jgi:hypothetical protein
MGEFMQKRRSSEYFLGAKFAPKNTLRRTKIYLENFLKPTKIIGHMEIQPCSSRDDCDGGGRDELRWEAGVVFQNKAKNLLSASRCIQTVQAAQARQFIAGM